MEKSEVVQILTGVIQEKQGGLNRKVTFMHW